MTEKKTEQPEHPWPWPFEGRIPLYVNGVQEGWVGPILSIEPMGAPVPIGEFEGETVTVVDVEISEDGSITVDGEPVETVLDSENKSDLYEWFRRVLGPVPRHVEGRQGAPGPFDKFKFKVEGSSADTE